MCSETALWCLKNRTNVLEKRTVRSVFRVDTLNIVSIQNHVPDVNGRRYRLTSENPLGQVDQLLSISFRPERDRSHDA